MGWSGVERRPAVRERLASSYEEFRRRLIAGLMADGVEFGEAEERAQDALVEVFAGADRVENPDALLAYCWTIARRAHWRVRRDLCRSVSISDEPRAGEFADVAPGPAEAAQRRSAAEVLAGAMADVSERDRLMLWEHHVEGESCEVLAARHGLSQASVPNLLYRARCRARAALVAAELGY